MPNNNKTTTTTTTTTTNSGNGSGGGFFNGPNGRSSAITAGGGPSFSIGTWFGVPITIHYSYFLVLILSVIVSLRFLSFKVTLYEFIIMGPILFITILIHEFGHIKTSQYLGGEAIEIIMWPLGGLAVSSTPNPPTPKNMLLVAAGGPATHIFQMLFWIILGIIFHAIGNNPGWSIDYNVIMGGNFGDYITMICLGALYMNVLLFVFNLLLPAYPLDGGQIFANALLMCGLPPLTSAMITSITGMILSALLFIYAICSFFFGQNPFSILNAIIAIWVFMTSYELYKMYENNTISNHPLFRNVASSGANNETTERATDDDV